MNRRGASALLVTAALLAGAACGSNDAEPGVAAFCAEMRNLAASDGAEPGGTVGASTDLPQLVDELNRVLAVAPEEIRPDVQTITDTVTRMAGAAATAGGEGPAALDAAFGALGEDITTLDAASAAVEEYTASECGVSLGDGSP